MGGCRRNVDNPVGYPRSTVVNTDFDGLVVVKVGHKHDGPERKGPVCGGKLVIVEDFSAGSLFPLALLTVLGSTAH